MNIVLLSRVCYPYHPYGGLERAQYSLTLELARLGHNITLFTQPPTVANATVTDSDWRAHVTHRFVKYDTAKFLRRNSIPDRLINYPLFVRRLRRAIAELPTPPDIIHAQGLTGAAFLPKWPARLVLNPQGMEEFKSPTLAKRLAYTPFRVMLRHAAHHAAVVIATDTALIPEVSQLLGVKPERVRMIPNAIDLNDIELFNNVPPEIIQNKNITLHKTITLLSVGRLEANKGFATFVKALELARAELAESNIDWCWQIVGAGTQRDSLQQQIKQAGLQDRVQLLGAVDNASLHQLYAQADLFVHPTLYEGSSLVSLEAMAHARPVLASRTAGLPDKVITAGDAQNGLLCPPGDAAAFAAALLVIVKLPPETRQQWGANSRKLVKEKFSWQAAARQTVALYHQLLAN